MVDPLYVLLWCTGIEIVQNVVWTKCKYANGSGQKRLSRTKVMFATGSMGGIRGFALTWTKRLQNRRKCREKSSWMLYITWAKRKEGPERLTETTVTFYHCTSYHNLRICHWKTKGAHIEFATDARTPHGSDPGQRRLSKIIGTFVSGNHQDAR